MAKGGDVEPNDAEIVRLLKGQGYPGVIADLRRRVARVVSAAGPGHGSEVNIGTNRAAGRVWTETAEAIEAEAKHRNLTRAFDAARGSPVERILFPDAGAAVIGALNAQLPALGFTGVPVRSKVPNPRPARFVLVSRAGGARAGLVIDGAQLIVEAWSTADAEAHDLAQAARAIIGGLQGTLTGGVGIFAVVEVGGPSNLPDPTSDQSRYTFLTIVNVRGVAA